MQLAKARQVQFTAPVESTKFPKLRGGAVQLRLVPLAVFLSLLTLETRPVARQVEQVLFRHVSGRLRRSVVLGAGAKFVNESNSRLSEALNLNCFLDAS